MNKKIQIILITICILLACNSIKVFAQVNLPVYLRQYYSYVDSAEIKIMDSEYEKAASYFDKAFACNKKAFGIDIYNAAVCESKNKDYKKTYIYLKHLISKGYSIQTLKEKECFNDFFDSRHGGKLIKKSKSITLNFNYQYREKLDSIKLVDNLFAQKYFDYVFQEKQYIDSIRKESLYDSLNLMYKQNSIFLEELIKNNGFPSEFIIGMDSVSLTKQPYFIIILHANQSTERQKGRIDIVDFSPYLNKAIEEGNIINSYAFDFLMNNKEIGAAKNNYEISRLVLIPPYHTTPSERHKMLIEKDSSLVITDWCYTPLDKEQTEKTNATLFMYGMGTAENIRRKIVFSMENKDVGFSKYSGSKKNYWLDEKQYEKVKQNFIPVQ